MPEYTIILKSETSTTDTPAKPTQPKKEGEDNKTKPNWKGLISIAENPDSAISMAKAKIIKAVPYAAVAAFAVAAVSTITNNIITTYNSFATVSSGDYKFQTEYNNFKTQFSNAFRPYSVAKQAALMQHQQNVSYMRTEYERELLAGTIINNKYGRYL